MLLSEWCAKNLPGGRESQHGFWNTRCPNHEDRHASFGINLYTGRGRCYSCGFKVTLAQLIEYLSDCTYASALMQARTIELKQEDGRPRQSIPQVETRAATSHPYFTERGLSEAIVWKYGLSHDPERNALAIPVHAPDGKRLVGYIYRSIDPAATQRYYHSEGLPKSTVLFGYHHLLRKPVTKVYVTEGAFDAMILVMHGYDAVSQIGSVLSPAQRKLLGKLNCEPIIVIDNDAVGLRNADALSREGFTIALVDTEFKDPGDMQQKVGTVELHEFRPSQWRAWALLARRAQDRA